MAALLVGSIALGVDKIKQHRAERKGKNTTDQAAGSPALSTAANEKQPKQVEEQLPSYEGATSNCTTTRPERPGAERRGRRGYSQIHGSNQADLHPLERDQQGADSALASVPEGGQAMSSFVDDEKHRLRRVYAERARARASDDGRRGRPNPVHTDEPHQEPPRYLERAPGSFRDRRLPQFASEPSDGLPHDETSAPAGMEAAPPNPPSYDAIAGEQQR